MKNFKIIILLLFFINTAFSQEVYIKHKISKGETLTSIANKYDVKIKEIYELNPKVKGVLKLNSILKIPKSTLDTLEKETTQNLLTADVVTHKVFAKETLYSISKVYGVTIESIYLANPIIEKKGLGIGMKLFIPLADTKRIKPQVAIFTEANVEESQGKSLEIKRIEVNNDNYIEHEVLQKQTKYGISKQYGITVQELEIQNPEIINGLPLGYKLRIKKSNEGLAIAPEEKPIIANSTGVVEDIVAVSNAGSVINESNPETPIDSNITTSEEKPTEYNSKVDYLVANAFENIGVRYRMGGTSKAGFDCSGLIINAFNTIDVKLPRTSREQSNYGDRIDRVEAKKGDLIFFSTNGSGHVNHVGMIVEVAEDDIKFIHASVHSGVVISSINESYYAKRFIQVNRVLQ